MRNDYPKDPFTVAYRAWERENDPKVRQFRPSNDVWARSHAYRPPRESLCSWAKEWGRTALYIVGGIGARIYGWCGRKLR